MVKEIIDSYLLGESILKISNRFKLSTATVWKCLKLNKIETRKCGLPRGERNPKRLFLDFQEIDICNEYKNGEIGKNLSIKYKTSESTISKILKRHGYQSRVSKETGKVGKYCSRYVGSVFYNKKGYRCLYKPDYKWCHKGGWIQEHRYIMQEHLGRKLKSNEHIHHINEIKTDNRLENLMIVNPSQHSKLHNKKGDL